MDHLHIEFSPVYCYVLPFDLFLWLLIGQGTKEILSKDW